MNDILFSAFQDELEKIAAKRSVFGNFFRNLSQVRISPPTTPPVSRPVPPSGAPPRSFRSISRKHGRSGPEVYPMIQQAKNKARLTGQNAHDIFEQLLKSRH